MSRIGKKPIAIPEGVTITNNGNNVSVKGPKGELTQPFDAEFKLNEEEGKYVVVRPTEQKRHKALHGLYRSLINNAVVGVTEGYKKELELVGVGYRANVQNNVIELTLGYSHNIFLQVPEEIKAVENLIKSEVNVKEIELIDDASGILVKTIKPNFKVLGPKFGKDMRFVAQAIQKLTQEDIAIVEKQGEISLEINGNVVNLTQAEVEITSQDIEGWLVANQGGITVALDVTITDDLRKEGNARELINRVQNLRKESGLEVNDRIKLTIQKNEILENSILANEQYIKNETLTNEMVFQDLVEQGVEINFDNVNTKILIEKL